MNEPIIKFDRVTKRFGQFTAVNNVSLTVPEGSIYGFIGPNGSGKTTTIRMIMNILLPDAGSVAVFGRHSSSTARDDVGYLPEERGLYKRMEVRRLLRYYGQLKGKSLKEIDPVGGTFDANLHDALSAQPSDDVPEGGVVSVIRTGFSLNGRLLRPASVIVSSGPADRGEAQA